MSALLSTTAVFVQHQPSCCGLYRGQNVLQKCSFQSSVFLVFFTISQRQQFQHPQLFTQYNNHQSNNHQRTCSQHLSCHRFICSYSRTAALDVWGTPHSRRDHENKGDGLDSRHYTCYSDDEFDLLYLFKQQNMTVCFGICG